MDILNSTFGPLRRVAKKWFSKPDSSELLEILSTPVSVRPIVDSCFRVAAQNGAGVNAEAVRSRHFGDGQEIALSQLLEVASEFQLILKPRRLTWEELTSTPWTGCVILILNNTNSVVVKGFRAGEAPRVAISDPLYNEGRIFFLSQQELESNWSGVSLVTAPLPRASEASKSFGFSWFVEKLLHERRLMRDIFLSSVTMHFVALAVPLFFQILLDRVLPNRAMTTLITVSVGVVGFLAFDAAFNYLRNYMLAHLSRRFELTISNEIVEHLMSLSVDFFHRNPSGVLVHKLGEANQVREFLASRLFNTFLDMTAVVIFIPVLAIYSLPLTLVVVTLALLTFGVLMLAAKRFRTQIEALNAVEGRRKGYLLELIYGISTIKSFAIESQCLRQWRHLSSESVLRGLDLGETSAVTRATVTCLEKLVPVLVGVVGVMLVLNEQMTVGALVAFNMLGYRVSGPLIQCSSLLQEYQRAVISLGLLGELFNTPPEPSTGQLVPQIKGAIEFEDVSFSYPGQTSPAISGASFRIEPGQTIGVIGRSGSGKTTITRLLQKFYAPQSGIIRIDGHDVKEIETSYLRSEIGVVLQDAFFFRGSVRDNIALSKPDASMEEVVQAAMMAGAHEFVEHMAYGYMTKLDENATNLSGGQRQRLAIARVLLNRPRLLIFDEATSALDPESELVVRKAMKSICRGRTSIIVTHRLSFVRGADQIIVMDRGQVAAIGPHDILLKTSSIYSRFWEQQAGIFS